MQPGNSQAKQDMRAHIEKLVVKPVGWLGLAYLGYWVALALQSVVVPAVIIPLLGGSVTGWAVTPWQTRFTSSTVEATGWLASSINLLPLLLQVFFLAVAALFGERLRPATLPHARPRAGELLAESAAYEGLHAHIIAHAELLEVTSDAKGDAGGKLDEVLVG